jgi:hypothetical protein
MKQFCKWALAGVLALGWLGCRAEVETTDDSVRVGAELPRVERGEQPLDLDPQTDDDLDVDTPAPGDR